ncbi:MAG: hypothetical protein IPM27_04930 [Nitrosomonadales bacterium]|nr:hypothetical protein [Nitrosomonadales bacterium]
MKTRLGIFVLTLLLLPPAGLFLGGAEWSDLDTGTSSEKISIGPTITCIFMLISYLLLINKLVKITTGNSPLAMQLKYHLALGAAGIVLGWLLVYLNLFAANWSTAQRGSEVLFSILFALLAPAVSITRALLGSLRGWLKYLARGIPLPVIGNEPLAFGLIPVAALGLLGGAAWPAYLFWLMWLSPLLLLLALQLLWHESTLFSGLRSGDWGRLICTALAGLIVGNLSVYTYQAAGGSLIGNLTNPLFPQLGYVLFGLLCLQLGDVIAEQWRGKPRGEVFKKKPFPIPVVSRKDQ